MKIFYMPENLTMDKKFVHLINKTFIWKAIATKLIVYNHIHKGSIHY